MCILLDNYIACAVFVFFATMAAKACSFLLTRNAHAIALFLEGHPGVDRVIYPGLESHPQHELAKQQQHGFGAMITFYCKGGRPQSAAILENVSCISCTRRSSIISLAISLTAV